MKLKDALVNPVTVRNHRKHFKKRAIQILKQIRSTADRYNIMLRKDVDQNTPIIHNRHGRETPAGEDV